MRFFTTAKISENIHKTPEGFLLCLGVPIGHTGDMVYGEGETPLEVGPDGLVVVTRDAKELFHPETIASFEGKAITIRHPQEFVNPDNWSELANGVMQNVRRGRGEADCDLLADFLITAKRAIELILEGLRQVSLGYEASYTQTGIGRGYQTGIVGNHCALVDEGRAGATYAINDHKGKGSKMKLSDKIKAIFAKAQDEALKQVGESDETPASVGTGVTNDQVAKMVTDLATKVDAMAKAVKKVKAKDEIVPAASGAPAAPVVAPTMEERMAKLETAVSMILERLEGDDDEDEEEDTDEDDGDDDSEEVTDEDGDDEVTDEDNSDEEDKDDKKKKTGDRKHRSRRGPDDEDDDGDEELASQIEILAPGMNPDTKNAKAKALIAAYATKDGKTVIDLLNRKRPPSMKDNRSSINMLFAATVEGLKRSRTNDLSRTRTNDFISSLGQPKGAMTPEEMNAANEKHYNRG